MTVIHFKIEQTDTLPKLFYHMRYIKTKIKAELRIEFNP